MSSLDAKMSQIAEQVLKRPLTEDEQLEIYKISDAMGMANVQSFLYQLLVFKLHEDTLKKQFEQLKSFENRLNEKFDELAAFENKINDTLEGSIKEILSDGAQRIGADMGKSVAEQTKSVLTSVGEYHSLRGQVLIVCFTCLISAMAYWLGSANVLRVVPDGSVWETILFLPAGWSVFFCGLTYMFFWAADHWDRIKRTISYKVVLGLQIFLLLFLSLPLF